MKPPAAAPADSAPPGHSERGSGTVLALALGLVLLLAAVMIAMLAQAATMASRAAAAADLAALAAADAARGLADGEPCTVAGEVARRHQARVLSCSKGAGQTVQVRTELDAGTMFGAATGLARAGPPPPEPATGLARAGPPSPEPATGLAGAGTRHPGAGSVAAATRGVRAVAGRALAESVP